MLVANDKQRLLDRPLEAVVGLLDIAILVAAPWGIAVGLHPVMLQRCQIAAVERTRSILQLVGRR